MTPDEEKLKLLAQLTIANGEMLLCHAKLFVSIAELLSKIRPEDSAAIRLLARSEQLDAFCSNGDELLKTVRQIFGVPL